MKNKKQKIENWEQLVMRIEKVTLDCYLNSISQEEARDKILKLLKSEKGKSYKDGLERAYEIICGYPEANVMQPRLDIKEEIKKQL